jgi:hypothetical protein
VPLGGTASGPPAFSERNTVVSDPRNDDAKQPDDRTRERSSQKRTITAPTPPDVRGEDEGGSDEQKDEAEAKGSTRQKPGPTSP